MPIGLAKESSANANGVPVTLTCPFCTDSKTGNRTRFQKLREDNQRSKDEFYASKFICPKCGKSFPVNIHPLDRTPGDL